MKRLFDSVRLVVIDSPYDVLASAPDCHKLFMDGLLLKLNSYRNVYPYGVMPTDTYDFISTHHIVGLELPGGFKPLMVYRMVTAEKCDEHRVPFPGLLALRGVGGELHTKVLAKLLIEWKEKGERISFGSAWAIAPELRADRELRAFLKDFMTAMLVHHEMEQDTKHLLACGMLGVHTDLYFKDIGYYPVESEGIALPHFSHASLMGAESILLHASAFNEKAKDLAEKFRSYWQNRIEFSARGNAAGNSDTKNIDEKKVA